MPWTCTPQTNTGGYKDCVESEDRDLVGYGLDSPSFTWPDGSVIALAFTLNYEEGAEFTPWNGDTRSNEFLDELYYSRSPVAKRDLVTESGFEYGIRAGLPRLHRLFSEFDWPMTIWACARSFEVTGFWPRLLADEGHEIACHGNRWRGTADLAGPDEEAESVRKSFKRLQAATGRTDVPTAFFTGNGSTYHRHIRARIHKELGVPLQYNSDSYAGDLPYWTPHPLALDGEEDDGLLTVPYSLTLNDHRFVVKGGTGTASTRDWFDLLKAEFDVLYDEGLNGHPKLMTIAMHSRILGKPARALALRRFMEYVREKDKVWVATRSQVAQFWKKEFPYEKVGVTAKTRLQK